MSQQPDPTIPFNASVVDEEALRALRAVQRNLPMGVAAPAAISWAERKRLRPSAW
jgi:hypothetical protein